MISILLYLLIYAIVFSCVIYLIQSWNPPPPLRNIVYGIVLICLLLSLFGAFGAFGPVPYLRR